MSDTVKDPRVDTPACPVTTCRAPAGSRWCKTPTGFTRHFHAARRQIIETGTAPAAPAAGALSRRRPTHPQADMLAVALSRTSGEVEVSGYNFHGDAQRRATMLAMASEARGWFVHTHSTDHCDVYRITEDGRAAWRRYDDWMHGRKS